MATICQVLPVVNSSLHCSGSSSNKLELFGSLSDSQHSSCSWKSCPRVFVSTVASSSRWESKLNEDYQRRCQIYSANGHAPSTSTDSPFTERYSLKKTRGRGSIPKFFFSAEANASMNETPANRVHHDLQPVCRESSNNIEEGSNLSEICEKSSQLPELREVLNMLRKRSEEENGGSQRRKGPGCVFLVGTGPGDPELLTVKALRLMQTADLVLYDRLVSTDILDLVHAGARLLYVGKTSGFHSRTQEEIHELLLNFAEAGATVVRLKGGDPLVFGRGGEEMDFLQEQGIQVKVVPGITAASGIAAELGIPLTHRGTANSVRFLTGHSRKGGDDPLYVTEQAADPDSTLVIYMGLATLPGLVAKLMDHGLSPDTPAAAVERGTTPQQRTVFSTLASLPAEVRRAELVSPTLIFIGQCGFFLYTI